MTTTIVQAAAASAVGVTKFYGSGDAAVRALDEVTLEVPTGELVAVMGPSGSGKSTLLHCMAGLDSVTSGHVFIGGRDLSELSDRDLTVLRHDHVGFVFQTFNLVPTMNARENIVLPFTLGGHAPDVEWLDEVIATVDLGDRLRHRPHELSGGQVQRVAVARALVTRPDIVFADEPTGNLDTKSGAEVLALLRRAVDRFRQTVVIVTHDPMAASHADAVVFLVDGHVVDRMAQPTQQAVFDRIKDLGG